MSDFVLEQIKRLFHTLFKKGGDSYSTENKTASPAETYGRGTKRWKDYHPNPPVAPRRNIFRDRD